MSEPKAVYGIPEPTTNTGWGPAFLELPPIVGPLATLVYARIYSYVEMDRGYCYARHSTLAEELGMSESTVKRSIAALVAHGYLLEECRKKQGLTNIYRLTGKLTIRTIREAVHVQPDPEGRSVGPTGRSVGPTGYVPQTYELNKELDKELNKAAPIPQKDLEAPAPPAEPAPVLVDAKHPAIVLFREVVKRYPNKMFFARVAEVLGANPDKELLRSCYEEWMLRGYNSQSLIWLTEWYAQGGPPLPVVRPGPGRAGELRQSKAQLTHDRNMEVVRKIIGEERRKNGNQGASDEIDGADGGEFSGVRIDAKFH